MNTDQLLQSGIFGALAGLIIAISAWIRSHSSLKERQFKIQEAQAEREDEREKNQEQTRKDYVASLQEQATLFKTEIEESRKDRAAHRAEMANVNSTLKAVGDRMEELSGNVRDIHAHVVPKKAPARTRRAG